MYALGRKRRGEGGKQNQIDIVDNICSNFIVRFHRFSAINCTCIHQRVNFSFAAHKTDYLLKKTSILLQFCFAYFLRK